MTDHPFMFGARHFNARYVTATAPVPCRLALSIITVVGNSGEIGRFGKIPLTRFQSHGDKTPERVKHSMETWRAGGIGSDDDLSMAVDGLGGACVVTAIGPSATCLAQAPTIEETGLIPRSRSRRRPVH